MVRRGYSYLNVLLHLKITKGLGLKMGKRREISKKHLKIRHYCTISSITDCLSTLWAAEIKAVSFSEGI